MTRVGVITGLDRIGIPVVMVARPNGRSLSVSQGKGADLVSAKISGLMEAAEAWHAEHVGLPLRTATERELAAAGDAVVDVDRLPKPLRSVFDRDLPIPWVEGFDVVAGAPAWVPYECVHLDFRVPGPPGTGCFLANSTGLAAGNDLLEAVGQALWEVVERDAFAFWEASSDEERARRRVDLTTVDDARCRDLLDRYAAASVGVAAWELTTDVGLPVFTVTVVDRHPDLLRRLPVSRGGGCHVDRGVALARALTEAAQSRLTIIAGSRDDVGHAYYRAVRNPDAIAGHRTLLDEPAPRAWHETAAVPGASLEDDVAHTLDRLRRVGVDSAVLVDLTSPQLGIPVARLIVPGLEGWSEKAAQPRAGRRLAGTRA